MRKIFLLLTFLAAYVGAQSMEQDSLANNRTTVDSSFSIDHGNDTLVLAAKKLHGFLPLSEVLGQNLLVWSWDRFYLQKHYAEISLTTMQNNMHNGFSWDANHYAINFFGHPYQGTLYYNAARSAGYGFYPSFAYTALGSFTWEVYMERENPSTNDLLVTSIGGATLGEMLYRFSARLVDHPKPNLARRVGALAFSPMGEGNRYLFGKRGYYPGYVPIEMSVFVGAGAHTVSEYSYDNEDVEDSKTSWKGRTLAWGMDLSYGRPGRKVRAPFEYFTINYGQIADNQGTLMNVETMGTLKNFTMGYGKNWVDLSLQLSYDVMYGDLVEMSANSIGPSVDFNLMLSDRWRFRLSNSAGWVVIGASDFNYEDVLVAQDSSLAGELRTYQLGMGLNYKNRLELEWLNRGHIYSHSSLYGLRTMPKSAPHYGATGWDVVSRHDVSAEAYLPYDFSLGYRFDIYWKIAAYRKFEPMMRVMATNWLYLRYNF